MNTHDNISVQQLFQCVRTAWGIHAQLKTTSKRVACVQVLMLTATQEVFMLDRSHLRNLPHTKKKAPSMCVCERKASSNSCQCLYIQFILVLSEVFFF